jgi:hypothetical protein
MASAAGAANTFHPGGGVLDISDYEFWKELPNPGSRWLPLLLSLEDQIDTLPCSFSNSERIALAKSSSMKK